MCCWTRGGSGRDSNPHAHAGRPVLRRQCLPSISTTRAVRLPGFGPGCPSGRRCLKPVRLPLFRHSREGRELIRVDESLCGSHRRAARSTQRRFRDSNPVLVLRKHAWYPFHRSGSCTVAVEFSLMAWPSDGSKGVGATTGDRTRTPGLARRDSTVELPSQGDDAYGLVSRGCSFLTLLVVVGLARIGGGRRRWLAVDPVPQALWLVGDLRPDSSRAGPSSGRTEPNMCAQQRHARVARHPGRSVGET